MKTTAFVKVPASSGNLGPGYDVLGLALDLYNEVRVRVLRVGSSPPSIKIVGEGSGCLATGARNIIFKAIRLVFSKANRGVPSLDIVCRNRIPLARGLGSSSSAYLSGLLAGNRLLEDRFSKEQILRWASALEGHPDNVAPALYGGIQASACRGGEVVTVRWPAPAFKVVVAIPEFTLSTKRARKILPQRVPLKDAVRNISAVAMMREALSGRTDLMSLVFDDRLHEPYRARLIPGFWRVKAAALKAGAVGVILSGAGPSILGFVRPATGARVGKAMKKAFLSVRVRSRILRLGVQRRGAIVR